MLSSHSKISPLMGVHNVLPACARPEPGEGLRTALANMYTDMQFRPSRIFTAKQCDPFIHPLTHLAAASIKTEAAAMHYLSDSLTAPPPAPHRPWPVCTELHANHTSIRKTDGNSVYARPSAIQSKK